MRKFAILFLLFPFTRSAAQSPDSLIAYSNPRQDTLSTSYNIPFDSLSLYNGRRFYGYPISIEGNAFYRATGSTPGSVLYNNTWFYNVQLMYDIYQDQLIVKHPPPFELNVIIFKERIPEFIIGDQVFVYLPKDKDGVVDNGFYQKLTHGKAIALARRAKLLEEKTSNLQVEQRFIENDHFFVLKDGIYHSIKKQNDLLELFNDKRQEIHDFRSRFNQKFKKNPEQYIIALTNYYNQLP